MKDFFKKIKGKFSEFAGNVMVGIGEGLKVKPTPAWFVMFALILVVTHLIW